MGLKGVLFDLDGTLIHFQIDYTRARRETIRILEEAGYPKGIFSEEMMVLDLVVRAVEYFVHQRGYEWEMIERIKKEVGAAVELVEKEAAVKATPIPAMQEILEFLSQNHIKLGILTFNTVTNAILSIEAAGIDKYFPNKEYIVGRDSVEHPKPNPEHALELLNRMELSAEEVVVVGDHPKDIACGNNINARTIAFVNRHHVPEEFETDNIVREDEICTKMKMLLTQMMGNDSGPSSL